MHSHDIHTSGLQKKSQIFILFINIYIYVYLDSYLCICMQYCAAYCFYGQEKLKPLPVSLYLGACCN